jgi:hypothetical protein
MHNRPFCDGDHTPGGAPVAAQRCVVHDDQVLIGNTKAIATFAEKQKLPSCGFLEYAAAGGLSAYGVSFVELCRRAAYFVDKILTVEEDKKIVSIAPRHICILFRRFRNFSADVTRPYVRALEARRVSHVLVGGRSFHDREEVISLRNALAAIECPCGVAQPARRQWRRGAI